MEEMKPREPEMVQRIAGLPGEDATADYVKACRQDFVASLIAVFPKIALGAFHGDPEIEADSLRDAAAAYQEYFRLMKGQVSFSQENVQEFVLFESERQRCFYRALLELADRFRNEQVKFEILPPDDNRVCVYWDTGLISGSTVITESGALLYACPLVPAETTDYMALRQEPVAANILCVTPDLILFLPVNQAPGDRFAAACRTLFPLPRDISVELPAVYSATLANGFLLTDGAESLSSEEIEDWKIKYRVNAVVTADSGKFRAQIYTAENDRLIRPDDLPAVLSI